MEIHGYCAPHFKREIDRFRKIPAHRAKYVHARQLLRNLYARKRSERVLRSRREAYEMTKDQLLEEGLGAEDFAFNGEVAAEEFALEEEPLIFTRLPPKPVCADDPMDVDDAADEIEQVAPNESEKEDASSEFDLESLMNF
jgi:hypothetical protein